MTMGDRIRILRENHNMTQEELGELLNVQKSAIAKYERGAVENIKRKAIQLMADRFGVSPCYLMWGIETEEKDRLAVNSEPEYGELIRLYSQLPKDLQMQILGIVKSFVEARGGKTDPDE